MAEMDSRQKELLDQFINVTDVDQERAKFYLESAAWDLQVALAGFYDEEGDDDIQEIASISREVGPPPPAAASNEPKVLNEEQQDPQQTSKNASKYATIFGVSDSHESDEEEGQAFYAGGSERSGQQILGPKKKSKNDFVGDMFKAAKDLGAEVVDPDIREDVSRRPATFQGAGYRLGDNDDDDIEIISASTSSASKAVKPKKDIVLKMWKGGFSVDDAVQQRGYDDPTNRDFLESIRRGEIPVELIREARGGEVSLTMEDHRNEDFETPRNNLRVFSGKGHMLGSPAPSNWTNTTPSTPDEGKSLDSASKSIKLDESQPVTTIQIRLTDGSRLIARLNHHHTIGDLRQYITIARPQFQAVTFTLMTTFPNRELVDDKKTIKDENLLNAVVMQKMI